MFMNWTSGHMEILKVFKLPQGEFRYGFVISYSGEDYKLISIEKMNGSRVGDRHPILETVFHFSCSEAMLNEKLAETHQVLKTLLELWKE